MDAGENVSVTLKREFCEEALSSLTVSGDDLDKIRTLVNELFAGGEKVKSYEPPQFLLLFLYVLTDL